MKSINLENLSSPKMAIKMISYWPPFYFSGIKVIGFNESLTEVTVRLKSGLINKNYKGTHFGGSLYSMIDPFDMFMVINALDKSYRVWDYSAKIDFIKATSKTVIAKFHLSNSEIEEIKEKTQNNEKFIASFSVEIIEQDTGDIVAKAIKEVYVRKKNKKLLHLAK
jgi:acyl-coenzyme A thioesterase PaaI-like protein